MRGPLLLVVIDGFGLAAAGPGNAIALARTPVFDRLFETCPWTPVLAAGRDVGLPTGIMGNSEVGHLNIGAGRIVPQDIVRIDESIESGRFFDNEVLRGAALAARRRGGRLHLMGLYSDGNVHSSAAHVGALVELASRELPPERVLVHAFTDGRDTPPRSAARYLADLGAQAAGKATLASVSGRYYAMDRDQRWDRLERAWSAVVLGEGLTAADAQAAVAASYARGEGDEFVQPTVLDAVAGQAPLVRAGDAVVFWNFRADRARQMCAALADPDFTGFDRRCAIQADLHLASMTRYEERQSWPSAFPPQTYEDLLVDVWARHGLKQLRIAETEKYAHVTYFFSGGREGLLPREERILIPSPKVATYDLQPEMSVPAVTERLLAEIGDGRFDAIVLNFASPDMVGHTGVIPATVGAVETVDECVGRLVDEVTRQDGLVAITADHGNAEQMIDPVTGEPHTAHTTNPVPLLICGAAQGVRLGVRSSVRLGAPDGGAEIASARLADIAPTLLELMELPRPAAMTGRSLVRAP